MENQHWDQGPQEKGGMKPLKLLPKFMGAQMNIPQPVSRECLTPAKEMQVRQVNKICDREQAVDQ